MAGRLRPLHVAAAIIGTVHTYSRLSPDIFVALVLMATFWSAVDAQPVNNASRTAAPRGMHPSTPPPPTSWRWSRRRTSSSPISRVTKDGVLICLHDDTLERTTNVAEVFPDRAPRRWRPARRAAANTGSRTISRSPRSSASTPASGSTRIRRREDPHLRGDDRARARARRHLSGAQIAAALHVARHRHGEDLRHVGARSSDSNTPELAEDHAGDHPVVRRSYDPPRRSRSADHPPRVPDVERTKTSPTRG